MQETRRTNSFYSVRILLPLFLSCICWNAIRRSLSEATPSFLQSGFFTQTDYALLNTLSFIVYGISKIVTSHFSRGNLFTQYSVLFLVVGCLTFFLSWCCSSGLFYFSFVWTINYMAMGTLWPVICLIFKKYLPDNCRDQTSLSYLVRGTYWSIICCCSSIGSILCNILSQYVKGNPRSIFFSLSVLTCLTVIFVSFLFPHSLTEVFFFRILNSDRIWFSESRKTNESANFDVVDWKFFYLSPPFFCPPCKILHVSLVPGYDEPENHSRLVTPYVSSCSPEPWSSAVRVALLFISLDVAPLRSA